MTTETTTWRDLTLGEEGHLLLDEERRGARVMTVGVPGMVCDRCGKRAASRLLEMSGVLEARLLLGASTLEVRYEPASLEDLDVQREADVCAWARRVLGVVEECAERRRHGEDACGVRSGPELLI